MLLIKMIFQIFKLATFQFAFLNQTLQHERRICEIFAFNYYFVSI